LQGGSLDSLENFPEPGFDMDEITAVANLEIHFVDSSGVVSWDFVGRQPYPRQAAGGLWQAVCAGAQVLNADSTRVVARGIFDFRRDAHRSSVCMQINCLRQERRL
jgi:hypothetical protein